MLIKAQAKVADVVYFALSMSYKKALTIWTLIWGELTIWTKLTI